MQERQIDEHAVEDVASVDERGVGDESLGHQARQGELRPFTQERADIPESGGGDRLPSDVVEVVLVRIDDDMCGPLGPLQNKGLCDGQGRTAVGETDLDHGPGVVVDQKVAQEVTVLTGQRDQREVAIRSSESGPDLGQSPSRRPHGIEERRCRGHLRSLAERLSTRRADEFGGGLPSLRRANLAHGRGVTAMGSDSRATGQTAGMDATKEVMLSALEAQRDHVLGSLEGLDSAMLRRPALPTKWNCLGMVQHLALDVERFWFRQTVAGEPFDGPGDSLSAWVVGVDTPPEEVLALYRDEIERANAIIRATPLEAPPEQWADHFGSWRLPDLRAILLHVIVETACHAGHLDAARELIDGKTWLILD